jgi:hypothetical protein
MLKEDVVTDVCLDSGISLNPILKDVKVCVSNISINELYYNLIFIDVLKPVHAINTGQLEILVAMYTQESVSAKET